MPRSRVVEFAGKSITVHEKRIGELETLVRELFPSTKGKLKNLDKALGDLEVDWDLLYKKLPIIFPDISSDDVRNAYMSELEALLKAFFEVNFFVLKQALPGLLTWVQIGLQQK